MNSPYDPYQRIPLALPATEALNRTLSEELDFCQISRERSQKRKHDGQMTASPQIKTGTQRKVSFDMIDLINATKPLEESIAFPIIEWNLDDDDDESDHRVYDYQVQGDPHNSSSHSYSSPSLGKRAKRHHRRMVRSMSLKSSMCFLADQPDSIEGSPISAREGSWGQFDIFAEDEERQGSMTLSNHSFKRARILQMRHTF